MPTVSVDQSTHHTTNILDNRGTVQQSTGSSSSQKMNVNAPAKTPIIIKIIISIIIGLA